MSKKFPKESQITEHLKRVYGIHAVKLTHVLIGADVNARVYNGKSKDKQYFIKVKQGNYHDISFAVINLLIDSGIEQIISPIQTILGELSCFIGNHTLIVYPFVKGEDGFSRGLTDEQWVSLGRTVKHIHDIHVPLAIQKQMRQETYSSQFRDAVRLVMNKIDEISAKDEIGTKLLDCIKRKAPIINELVDSAEHLSQKVQELSSNKVLCHADLHGGNVLVDEPGNFYIVDWDAPIMASKERDLMFIGAGVGNVWNKSDESDLFYQGYGAATIEQVILAYYRADRILEDIAGFSQNLLISPIGSPKEREESFQHYIDMFSCNGVVEIALRTMNELHN